MGKAVHREVIDGHMTVTQVRRIPGAEYKVTEAVGLWGRETREVTKRHPGHLCVESLVYAGEKEEGEPVAEWELPHQLRYSLSDAAHLAVRQTKFDA